MKHIKKTLEIITLHKIWSAFFTWPSAPNIITLTKFTSLSLKMNNVSVRTYSFLRKKCLNLILLPTQPPNTYYKQSRIHKKLYCRCLMRFWIYLWQVNNNYTGLVYLFCAKLKCIKWKYSGMDQLKFVVDSMTKFETTWSVKQISLPVLKSPSFTNFYLSTFDYFLPFLNCLYIRQLLIEAKLERLIEHLLMTSNFEAASAN